MKRGHGGLRLFQVERPHTIGLGKGSCSWSVGSTHPHELASLVREATLTLYKNWRWELCVCEEKKNSAGTWVACQVEMDWASNNGGGVGKLREKQLPSHLWATNDSLLTPSSMCP